MRYALAGTLVALMLALPAGAAAKLGKPQSDPQATGMCTQERAKLGTQAFRNKYGYEHPGRACVKVTRQLINAAWRLAGKDCKGELALYGPDDFVAEYGTDDTSTVGDAMAACIAEEVHTILYPDDSSDDPTDDGSDG